MSGSPRQPSVHALIVVVAGWLLPGAGYALLKQHGRAMVVGLTIIALFVGGLLIGGIRALEVPGFDAHGNRSANSPWTSPTERTPLEEVRSKPWIIAQVMAGPISIVADWLCITAAKPGPDGQPMAARSHSRINELGVLYTAVAGMLNLLAIIDSGYRAGQTENS